jgi:transposase-like protein
MSTLKCPNPKCHKSHPVKLGIIHNKILPDKQRYKCQGCGSTFYAVKDREK